MLPEMFYPREAYGKSCCTRDRLTAVKVVACGICGYWVFWTITSRMQSYNIGNQLSRRITTADLRKSPRLSLRQCASQLACPKIEHVAFVNKIFVLIYFADSKIVQKVRSTSDDKTPKFEHKAERRSPHRRITNILLEIKIMTENIIKFHIFRKYLR